MFQMSSHDSFKYLKHKLWLKEGLGVKVSIWIALIYVRAGGMPHIIGKLSMKAITFL